MRHRVQGTALGRDTKHRKALVKNLLASLFQHGAVETTEEKAKAIKRLADKVITKGKPGTLNARRTLERFFGQRQIVNHILDSVVPVLKDRNSGYTRMTRLGKRRGDDAAMVKLELTAAPLIKPVVEAKEAKKPVAKKAAAANVEKAEKAETKTAKKVAPVKKAVKKAPAAKKPAEKSKSKAKKKE